MSSGSIKYKDGRNLTIESNEYVSKPSSSSTPSSESSNSRILIFVLLAIAVVLAVLAIFAASSVGNNQSNMNDDIDKLEKDVNNLNVITTDLTLSNSTLQQKTTDLTYSNNTSTFSKNLNVGQTLTVNGKNISDILNSIDNEAGSIVLENDLIVNGIIYAENKNVNNTLSHIDSTSSSTNFSKNVSIAGTLTVAGKDINKIVSGITVTDTEITLSKNLNVDGNISSENLATIDAEILNLNVNGKNIGQTLSTITTDDDITTLSGSLIIQDSLLLNGKNVNETLSGITYQDSNTTISENLTVDQDFILDQSDYKLITEIPNESRMTLSSGTGPGNTFQTFDNAIYSNGSIGFVNKDSECKTLIDPDNGIVKSTLFETDENVICKNSTCGYMISSDNPGEITLLLPIVMSVKKLIPANKDDYWIVNPGFKFILYKDPDYQRRYYEIDNILGTTTLYVKISDIDPLFSRDCESIKVIYKDQLISPFPDISI